MDWTRWDPLPVGVRTLSSSEAAVAASPEDAAAVPVYQGPAYCDAISRAGQGEALRVLPGSIEVCGWSPVVLGLKEPTGHFEAGLAPRLAFPVAGLLLAPLDRFPGVPDLVVVRARPELLLELVRALGGEGLWTGHAGQLDRSAVPLLRDKLSTRRQGLVAARGSLIGGTNRLLAVLARSHRWRAFTYWLFRSPLITAGFDALISHTVADMSICRNSTAIPLLTGCTNLSFFCTGGITWGGNDPDSLTSGWPWPLFEEAIQSSGSLPSQGDADD